MPKSSKSKDQLEFEITFYEQLVQAYPDFSDAIMALANTYTRRGWYDKGLALDQRLARELRPGDPVAWYNLACSYSLTKHTQESLESLQRAIKLGYDDFEYLGNDPDLAFLRNSPEFQRFLRTLSPSRSA